MRNTFAGLLALPIALLLSACQPTSPPTPTPTPYQLADLYATTPAPSRTPRPTTTPKPSPTVFQSPTPRPTVVITERRLDSEGPWIIAYHPVVSSLYLTNLDGTGQTPLNLPASILEFNERGRLRNVTVSDSYLVISIGDLPREELWIVRLPDGIVLRKIALIGEEAQQAIDNYIPPTPGGFYHPPIPPVTLSIGWYTWSPDGNYLAFVGAMDGPSGDVYIYHPESDRLRRLTSGPGQTNLLGWSPDSRRIIHKSGEVYDDHFILWGKALWSVDIDGNIELISTDREIAFNPRIAGWINDHTYVSYTPVFEGNPQNLALVDISSKKMIPIDAPQFLDAIYDPHQHRLLINWGTMMGPQVNGFGIYEYALENHELQDFASEINMDGLLTEHPYYLYESGRSTLLADVDGNILLELDCIYCDLSISPNNAYLMLPMEGYLFLADAQLNIIAEIEHGGRIYWLPDSSGFFAYNEIYTSNETNTYSIYFYSAANDWQPVLVNYIDLLPPFYLVQP